MKVPTPLLIAGFVVACLIGVPALVTANKDHPVVPQRATVTVEATQTPAATKELEKPLVIKESDILRVEIPSVMIDAKVSGATMPRPSPNCHGGPECIDPPVLDQAAWFGAYSRPAIPSTNSVLLFGHSSSRSPLIFNNLPAVVADDAIIVTTQTGVFTYRANAPELVPYETSNESKLVFEPAPNKLVLVTCNDAAAAGTVVVAYLSHAVPR